MEVWIVRVSSFEDGHSYIFGVYQDKEKAKLECQLKAGEPLAWNFSIYNVWWEAETRLKSYTIQCYEVK